MFTVKPMHSVWRKASLVSYLNLHLLDCGNCCKLVMLIGFYAVIICYSLCLVIIGPLYLPGLAFLLVAGLNLFCTSKKSH